MSEEIQKGARVLVPRSSGKLTPGTVTERWGDKVQVRLDQLGRRGQALGKVVWAHELKPL